MAPEDQRRGTLVRSQETLRKTGLTKPRYYYYSVSVFVATDMLNRSLVLSIFFVFILQVDYYDAYIPLVCFIILLHSILFEIIDAQRTSQDATDTKSDSFLGKYVVNNGIMKWLFIFIWIIMPSNILFLRNFHYPGADLARKITTINGVIIIASGMIWLFVWYFTVAADPQIGTFVSWFTYFVIANIIPFFLLQIGRKRDIERVLHKKQHKETAPNSSSSSISPNSATSGNNINNNNYRRTASSAADKGVPKISSKSHTARIGSTSATASGNVSLDITGSSKDSNKKGFKQKVSDSLTLATILTSTKDKDKDKDGSSKNEVQRSRSVRKGTNSDLTSSIGRSASARKRTKEDIGKDLKEIKEKKESKGGHRTKSEKSKNKSKNKEKGRDSIDGNNSAKSGKKGGKSPKPKETDNKDKKHRKVTSDRMHVNRPKSTIREKSRSNTLKREDYDEKGRPKAKKDGKKDSKNDTKKGKDSKGGDN